MMMNKENAKRSWKLELGTGDRVILVLPRMDADALSRKEWLVSLAPYLTDYTFLILDVPEKLIQEHKGQDSFTVPELAQWAHDYVKKNNITPYMIWGFSLGGMMAQYLSTFNEYADTPVLLVSTMLCPNKKLKAVFSTWYMLCDKFGVKGLQAGLVPWVVKESELPLFQLETTDREDEAIAVAKMKAGVQAIINHNGKAYHEQMKSPIQIIFGEESILLGQEESEYFERYLPQANIDFIHNSGMRMFGEKPEEVKQVIEKFIDSHFGAEV